MGGRGFRSLAWVALVCALMVVGPADAEPANTREELGDLERCMDAPDRPMCVLRQVARHESGTLILTDRDLAGQPELLAELGVSWAARDAWRRQSLVGQPGADRLADDAQEDRAVIEALALYRGGASPEAAIAPIARLPLFQRAAAYSSLFPGAYGREVVRWTPDERLRPLLVAATVRWKAVLDEMSKSEPSWAATWREDLVVALAGLGDPAALTEFDRSTFEPNGQRMKLLAVMGRWDDATALATGDNEFCGGRGHRTICQRILLEAATEAERPDIARQVADAALAENGPETVGFSTGERGEMVVAASPGVALAWLAKLDSLPESATLAPGAVSNPYRRTTLLFGWRAHDPARYRTLLNELIAEARAEAAAPDYAAYGGNHAIFDASRLLLLDGDIETIRSFGPGLFIDDYLTVDILAGRGTTRLDLYLADARAIGDDDIGVEIARTGLFKTCFETGLAVRDRASVETCARRIVTEADNPLWADDLMGTAILLLDAGYRDLGEAVVGRAIQADVARRRQQQSDTGFEAGWLNVAKAELRAQGRLPAKPPESKPRPVPGD